MDSIGSPTTPTTFVQTDANTFRELVQKLTGLANGTDKFPVRRISPKHSVRAFDPTRPRGPPFKLQERRQHTMRKLEIKLGLTTLRDSPNQAPRVDSPVTPLLSESLYYSSPGTVLPSSPVVSEEEKAIAEKGFYLHPSPLNTPRGSQQPELLTLFPLSSPCQKNQD